jgi:hypothetical protein
MSERAFPTRPNVRRDKTMGRCKLRCLFGIAIIFYLIFANLAAFLLQNSFSNKKVDFCRKQMPAIRFGCL